MSLSDLLARPTFLRYLGLFGAVCCAVDAYLFGAGKYVRLHVSVDKVAVGPNGPIILLLWIIGLASLCTAWWFGRHLVGRNIVTTKWVLVTAAIWVIPFLLVPPEASRDVYAYACQGALYNSGHNPYVDSVSTQPCPWLSSVSPVWRTTPTPYGPIFILLSGLGASFGSQVAAIAFFRLLAVAALVVTAFCLPKLAQRLGVPADRAAWLLLCCPIISVHLVGGAHNDALTLAFMVAGLVLLAGARRGYGALVAGGALLGAGAAVKSSLGIVFPFAALLAAGGAVLFSTTDGLPRPGAIRALLTRGGTVMATALATLFGLSIVSGLGLGWVGAVSGTGRAVTWTSPSTAVGIAGNVVMKWIDADDHLNLVPWTRGLALLALPIALGAILWHSRGRNPLYCGGLAVLAAIFLAPNVQPWYLVWPLALIAVTTVRARWLAITAVASMTTVLPDGSGLLKALQIPLSFAMTGFVVFVAVRFVRWLRGDEPADDDFVALPAAPAANQREAAPLTAA